MIDTLHLLPPMVGCCSNPVLYGVAQALVDALPLGPAEGLPREAAITNGSTATCDGSDAEEVVGA